MSLKIIRSQMARIDISNYALLIAENSDFRTADRFLQATEDAFDLLAELPGIGAPRDYGIPTLKGMRMWPIPHYRNYLIYYRANEEEIEILRVINGARNIQEIFAAPEE